MINEEKITYRMKNLIESGFFGNKSLLTEAFADKDKVRLFQAAYNYTYDKNIFVDGIKGTQTNAAIEDVKKQLGKEKLDNSATEDFYIKFFEKMENDTTINVGEGGTNTNKKLNYAIQALVNLAGTPLGIDGVVGTKTIAAIKTVSGANTINKSNILPIINKSNSNVKDLGIEDIATVQSTSASADVGIDAGTDAGADDATKNKEESEKKWEKYPCITQADGIQKEILKDGSIAYVDKDNANRYYANGRKGNFETGQVDNFYCLKGKVMIGSDSDYTGGTKSKFGNCITGDCENGIGKLRNTEGNIYIGTFKNFYLTGEDNEIRRINGDIFKGETLNGFPVYGTYYYKVGTTYTGNFKPKSFDPAEKSANKKTMKVNRTDVLFNYEPVEQMAENILNDKRGKNNI